ncbi:MAG TPA: acyltransferase [Candidatus Binataceae bacterium]|nr:acyltransferase [Candidatus Binataceae bacterium]
MTRSTNRGDAVIGREHRYVPSLDGLRAICIAAVLFIHMPAPTGHPWLEAIRRRGWYGVDMFFILSGFLITWILAVEVENTGTVSLGRFYRARTLRLLPAYLSTIVLVLAGSRLFEIAQGNQSYRLADLWPLFLSYTLNIWMAATAIWPWGVSHFWSLCVEEHFYLSWSAVMKRWGLRRVLRMALVAIVAVAMYRTGWYLWMNRGHLASPSTASFFRIYYATDTRIDAILVGCALALLVRESRLQDLWRRLESAAWFPTMALLGMLGTIGWVTEYRWRTETFGYTVMAMASSTLLLAIFLQPQCWIARVLATRPLVHLGRISYGVYLFHAPLLTGLEAKLRFSAGYIEPARYLPMLALLTLGSVGAAALHYYLIERRFLGMRGPRPFLAKRAGLERCAVSE